MDRSWRRPGFTAVALAALGVAAFSALGVWQVDRAAEKERLFAAYANALAQTPVTLDAARRTPASAERYPLVAVHGHYDAAHAYLLVDQTHAGAVGSVAVAVFEPADGSTAILVDRGFVAGDASGAPPEIPPLPSGEQELLALYAPPPGSGLRLGGNPLPRQTAWPKQSIYLDVGEIAADLGRSLDSRILRLAPAPGSGFVREWRPDVFPPERHRAYAFTWFTLAAVVLAVFVGMHWQKSDRT